MTVLRRTVIGIGCAATTALPGCAGDRREAGDARPRRDSAAPATVPAGGHQRDPVAAQTLTWDVAAVEHRLRDSGLSPVRAPEPVRQPFMAVPGTLFRLSGGELQVYIYGDAGALSRDVAGLDTARVAPPTMMIEWLAKPTLITANNLAALLITNDDSLRRRVRSALDTQ